MSRKQRLVVICVLLSLFLLLYSRNSDTYQEKQEDIREEVTVTLKLVQVYVTDKKGKAITDLKPEDFELKDNGKRQRITDFEQHSVALPSISAETQPEKPQVRRPQLMPRKYFFLFDFAFNNLGGVKLAKRIASHFLKTQALPSDEVGVLSYSALKGLILHEYLTINHEKVQDVIQKVGSGEIIGRAGRLLEDLESQLRYGHENTLNGSVAAADRAMREDYLRIAGKEEYRHQVLHFCSTMRDFAKGMRHIPGNKNIIFFSTGIPNWVMYRSTVQSLRPGELPLNLPGTETYGMRSRYEKMTRDLAAANSPMFTVNVEGQDADFMEKEGLSEVSRIITKKDQPSAFIESRNMRGSTSLSNLAKDSGGHYFENMNNPVKIAEDIQMVTGSYYVLGYYIDEKWDGKYHKIKVKVNRKGCKVYAQRGYFNPKPFAEYDDLEKKIQLIDLALGEKHYFGVPGIFSLEALPVSVEDQSQAMLIINSHDQQIQAIAGEETEIVLLVFDERQNLVGHRGIRVKDPSFYKESVFTYAAFPLSPGKFECRAVVRNLTTGKGSVASSSLFVPDESADKIKLFPPLLFIPKGGSSYLNLGSREKKVGKTEYSELSCLYPYDAAQYSPLLKETEILGEKILALVRCQLPGIERSGLKLLARLLHEPTGEKIPLHFSLQTTQPDGTMILFSEIACDSMQPGKYYLYLYAQDINSQLKAHTNTSFFIKKFPE